MDAWSWYVSGQRFLYTVSRLDPESVCQRHVPDKPITMKPSSSLTGFGASKVPYDTPCTGQWYFLLISSIPRCCNIHLPNFPLHGLWHAPRIRPRMKHGRLESEAVNETSNITIKYTVYISISCITSLTSPTVPDLPCSPSSSLLPFREV